METIVTFIAKKELLLLLKGLKNRIINSIDSSGVDSEIQTAQANGNVLQHDELIVDMPTIGLGNLLVFEVKRLLTFEGYEKRYSAKFVLGVASTNTPQENKIIKLVTQNLKKSNIKIVRSIGLVGLALTAIAYTSYYTFDNAIIGFVFGSCLVATLGLCFVFMVVKEDVQGIESIGKLK